MQTISAATQRARPTDSRWLLIERIIASRHLNRSARLQEMLQFLAARVVDGHAEEVHEHEVGHEVFGRAPGYDTSVDNIVRVHASMLRKRLEQYFAAEGCDEPLIVEIPKGNYAPVFRERAATGPSSLDPGAASGKWRAWSLACTLLALVAVGAVLAWHQSSAAPTRVHIPPSRVQNFWRQLFQPGKATDVVLGDAAVAAYQQLDRHPLDVFDYSDRDYLRTLQSTAAAARMNLELASTLVLDRQTDFWNVSFLWGLARMPGARAAQTHLYFARDYSFHALKTDNAILVGDERSNPWIQLFRPHLVLPWATGQATPARSGVASRQATSGHEEYFALSLLPNLSGTGRVLLVASTGGGAIHAATKFLGSERDLEALAQCLHAGSGSAALPSFEGLFRVDTHQTTPRKVTIQVCQRIQ